MPSYFRNLFGGHSQGSTKDSKSQRTRSNSQPASAAYNPYGTPPPYSTSRSTAPSPLRYPTSAGSDTRSTFGYGRRNVQGTPRSEPRPQNVRRASFKTSEGVHYPTYTPSASRSTLPSSRSNSSSSLYQTVPGPGHVRSSSSDMGHGHAQPNRAAYPPRPILKQASTWHAPGSAGSTSSYGSLRGHSPVPSVSFAHAHSNSLHMHPLLATTRLHRAPISYDVIFTPSARTVLDRTTHSAIPPHTLSQPATEPAMSLSSRLVLRSHKFPWPVVVGVGSAGKMPPSSSGVITNLDVLYAIHTTLLTPVTPEEWDALGHGTKAQMKVTKAYEERCVRMGGGWEGGVRRVDWLGGKTRLVGVEVDKAEGKGVGKLVFGKA